MKKREILRFQCCPKGLNKLAATRSSIFKKVRALMRRKRSVAGTFLHGRCFLRVFAEEIDGRKVKRFILVSLS